jgi:hypothetical protein
VWRRGLSIQLQLHCSSQLAFCRSWLLIESTQCHSGRRLLSRVKRKTQYCTVFLRVLNSVGVQTRVGRRFRSRAQLWLVPANDGRRCALCACDKPILFSHGSCGRAALRWYWRAATTKSTGKSTIFSTNLGMCRPRRCFARRTSLGSTGKCGLPRSATPSAIRGLCGSHTTFSKVGSVQRR